MHRFLSDPRIAAFEALIGKAAVKASIAVILEDARSNHRRGVSRAFESLCEGVIERLRREQSGSLLRVVNATGVLLHTNLGRAPLAQAALHAITAVGGGYSNLEYDLEEGRRGSRYARARQLLAQVTGAQDGLVVNNCAAAVLLVLDTFAKGRDVIVSRNQLIEVGGGFRLPDVLARSGANVVEVGATNKVYLRDYERALCARTGLILRTHTSNYRIDGFTHDVEPRELAALGRRAGVPVAEDLGSGALVDLQRYGLPHERTVPEALADGVDVVTFSGDKLVGGPQSGIIAGSLQSISRLRNNPLVRALRVDKITLAALIETLRLYASPESLRQIPFFRMLGATLDELGERADRYRAALPCTEVRPSSAYAGGGTLPAFEIPSLALAFAPPGGAQDAAKRLRRAALPVIARIQDDRLLLDLRTIAPEEDRPVIEALQTLFP